MEKKDFFLSFPKMYWDKQNQGGIAYLIPGKTWNKGGVKQLCKFTCKST